ncbi:MAG TPA: Txe/YoeB family addiction module toxin [Streptosporangiaceae bacterium]
MDSGYTQTVLFTGIDKPEPLRYHLPGDWPRRIGNDHRLVYIVTGAEIILAAWYHY